MQEPRPVKECACTKETGTDPDLPQEAFPVPPGDSPSPPGVNSPCLPSAGNPEPVLLKTHPDPRSFVYKYALACFPVLLVLITICIRSFLEGMSRTLVPGIPGLFSTVVPAISSITTISILLAAPVGLFILVACIGWALRFTELWTSTALTLCLSILAGVVLTGTTGTPPGSEQYIIRLLHWIAFLVQPFCIIAVIIILAWTEKFRRSITYTILNDYLTISGGVWKDQEHFIPHYQVARVVLEQDLFGRMFNYGTVIPLSVSRWGAETAIRGVGAGGQKDNLGAILGYAKGREEASRKPLDCFFGIPDPKTAQQLMKERMILPATRDEAQVAYLKQICEKI